MAVVIFPPFVVHKALAASLTVQLIQWSLTTDIPSQNGMFY
jgi:hypothetical protein